MSDKPAISFNLFVLSLAASAEIHLGTLPPPGSDKPAPPNPGEAAHLIEVLAMLQDKTKGNLDEQETHLLESVLYDLRMRYVEVTSRPPAPAAGQQEPGAGGTGKTTG